MKKYLFLTLLLLFPLTSHAESSPVLVGGDRDTHGCIGSAGYTWSEVIEKCIRPWEYYARNIEKPPVTGSAKLDRMITRQAKLIETRFIRDAELSIRDRGGVIDPSSYSMDIHYGVESTGAIISVRMTVNTYAGGAHGSTVFYTWNYDTGSGRLIPLWKIISPKKLRSLEDTIRSQIRQNYAAVKYTPDEEWLERGTDAKTLGNYSNFTLKTATGGTPEKIRFYFAEYQIAPYFVGPTLVEVGLSSITPPIIEVY